MRQRSIAFVQRNQWIIVPLVVLFLAALVYRLNIIFGWWGPGSGG